LEIDRDDLLELVRRDARIVEASLEKVAPAERRRIFAIRGSVEPRARLGGAAQVFPGVSCAIEGVGGGVTHRLSGMTVVATAAYEGTIRAGTGVQRSGILDMWGPGAASSRFSKFVHLVLILRLCEGLGEFEA